MQNEYGVVVMNGIAPTLQPSLYIIHYSFPLILRVMRLPVECLLPADLGITHRG